MKSKIGIAIILCIFAAGSPLRDTMRAMFPGEPLQVAQSGGSLVLSGNASSKAVSDRAAAVAATMSPAVVNMVQTTEVAPARQAVLLQVKFAEVDRAAIQQLGMNLFSTGATNTLGAVSTQQFGPLSPVNARGAGGGATVGISDLLNVFLFRPDLNLGVTIRALQQKNL